MRLTEVYYTAVAAEPAARWPARVRELAALSRVTMTARSREALLTELWKLLNLALHKYVLLQVRRFRSLVVDDVVDITSDKSLELMGRLDRGQWDPGADSDAQICAFLASVARNGVIDLVRRRSRELPGVPASSMPAIEDAPALEIRSEADPESALDGSRYALAIVECAARLTSRARLVWFQRAFGGLSADEIARHPKVLTTRGGVELMLNRSRRALRKCMKAKGLEPARMPPGTFVALWEMIDADRRALDPLPAGPEA